MAVPEATNQLNMLKLARERRFSNYDGSQTITPPIHLSDLSRLTGGNSSGSGESYLAVNMLNSVNNRPDGNDPQSMGEFFGYNQLLSRTPFQFIYDSSSSSDACAFGLPNGTEYHHTDGDNLFPSALDGTFSAYTTATGFVPVSAGYYQIFDSDGIPIDKYIQVGSGGSIIGGGNC